MQREWRVTYLASHEVSIYLCTWQTRLSMRLHLTLCISYQYWLSITVWSKELSIAEREVSGSKPGASLIFTFFSFFNSIIEILTKICAKITIIVVENRKPYYFIIICKCKEVPLSLFSYQMLASTLTMDEGSIYYKVYNWKGPLKMGGIQKIQKSTKFSNLHSCLIGAFKNKN